MLDLPPATLPNLSAQIINGASTSLECNGESVSMPPLSVCDHSSKRLRSVDALVAM